MGGGSGSAKGWALLLVAMLAAYLVLAGARGLDLIRAGGVVPVLLGIAVLVLPLIGGWAIWHEWQFGRAVQRMGSELAQAGDLPTDDLPRRPSGRPVRVAADARFERVRAQVEKDPDDWSRWFHLGLAYDDAGDRRRARQSMRRARELHSATMVR